MIEYHDTLEDNLNALLAKWVMEKLCDAVPYRKNKWIILPPNKDISKWWFIFDPKGGTFQNKNEAFTSSATFYTFLMGRKNETNP